MRDLFFYGTLRHLPLLEIVIGRAIGDLAPIDAELPDHAVHWAAGQPFPMIVTAPGAVAKGVLLKGLGEEDMARIDYYEGGFDYALEPVTVMTGQGAAPAQVFFPTPGVWARGAPWSLDDWVADWGRMSLLAAREVMDEFGHTPVKDIARKIAMIRARATARLLAETPRAADYSGFGRGDVQQLGHARPYSEFFALDEYRLKVRQFDGSTSAEMHRAVFIATDAAIVLPYDAARDRVLCIEQFRPGPWGRGDPQVWQLEPVAGRIDAGETPEVTARRELHEEAGLRAGALHKVGNVYASPGASSEYYHIFVAEADLPDGTAGLGGVASEMEDIRSHVIGFDDLMRHVDNFEVANAPLAVAALWLARHRERLRGA